MNNQENSCRLSGLWSHSSDKGKWLQGRLALADLKKAMEWAEKQGGETFLLFVAPAKDKVKQSSPDCIVLLKPAEPPKGGDKKDIIGGLFN